MQTDRNHRHSGYAATVDGWRRFLSCWYREYPKHCEWGTESSLVKRDVLLHPPSASADAIREEIREHEARLGLALPPSYADFLVAYYPTSGAYRDRDFVHIAAIDVLRTVSPEIADLLRSCGVDAPDSEYFVYGMGQNDTTRVRYLDTSIVVGMHDDAPLYMIVLHPEVLTCDGEMEAEIFFHAGSLRAPSFAEMMRFLYSYNVRMPAGGSDFSQEVMRGTCADQLPMKGAWWK